LVHRSYFNVPNAVDTQLFVIRDQKQYPKKKIIHVSCFEDKSKNITGFLRAIRGLATRRDDFTVQLIGEGPDLEICKTEAGRLGLDKSLVNFPGLIENAELARIMAEADMLVLSSNYETFGTVVVESLACGIPVVATRVGIVPEVIDEINGIMVEPEDMKALEEAMFEMLNRGQIPDRKRIRESVAGKFDSVAIGKQLSDIYDKLYCER
jgi:glycosyltransferase involved in cell wall biosynthesis